MDCAARLPSVELGAIRGAKRAALRHGLRQRVVTRPRVAPASDQTLYLLGRTPGVCAQPVRAILDVALSAADLVLKVTAAAGQ